MPSIRASQIWPVALGKWTEIAAAAPELRPAIDLQQQMLRILIDAADALDDSTNYLPELTPERARDKWARGLPAFRNEPLVVPDSLRSVPKALCDVLAEGGAGDAAAHIGRALADAEIDAGSLLSVSFARNQKAMRSSALHHGFAPDLLWMIGELASSPLANKLWAGKIGAGGEFSDAALAENSPPAPIFPADFCALCGSWPALIEMGNVQRGQRVLRCSYCAAAWDVTPARCVYCGNSNEKFVVGMPDSARPDRRVEMCGACGGYTKALDVTTSTPFPLLAIDDLATLDLDQAAMAHGYHRPDLFDLDDVDPRPRC